MDIVFILYPILCFCIMFFSSVLSYKFNLVDLPSKRKIHSSPTSYLGGLAISFTFILSIYLFGISNEILNLIFSMGFLICLVGLIDDMYDLNVGNKLVLQIFPILYLIIFKDLELNSLGNYYYINLDLKSFAIPFTLLSVLFLINAFNYFDGIDGILSCSSFSVLMILLFLSTENEFRFYILITAIPVIVFLCFNSSLFKLPKMFLGDGGSLLLGFVVSFFLIYLANKNLVHPILLAWSVVIFVYEFISINLIRFKKQKNLFKAGHDHLHHLIFKISKSVFLTNFFIVTINIFLFIIGYLGFLVSPTFSMILFIASFFIFFIIRKNMMNIIINEI